MTDEQTVNDRAGDSVRAVNRALDILLAFKGDSAGLSAAQLLNRVDLSRPTLYRLLRTLEAKGFVEAFGEPQRFKLGPSIAQLVHYWGTGPDIADVAEPYMKRAWTATGETVALFVPEGMMRVCLKEMPSANPLSFRRGVGYKERLVLGASGRSILAYLDKIDLAEFAEGTAVDVEQCKAELARVRKRGYAVSRDELITGAVAIAAPIFGKGGTIAGSLGIFGPSVRLTAKLVEQFGKMLKDQCAALSNALGGFPAR